MSNKIDELIEVYENGKCRIKRDHGFHYPDASEINNVLDSIGAPRIAIDTSAPGENDGSELFIIGYYMILKLAKRIDELEKKLEEK